MFSVDDGCSMHRSMLPANILFECVYLHWQKMFIYLRENLNPIVDDVVWMAVNILCVSRKQMANGDLCSAVHPKDEFENEQWKSQNFTMISAPIIFVVTWPHYTFTEKSSQTNDVQSAFNLFYHFVACTQCATHLLALTMFKIHPHVLQYHFNSFYKRITLNPLRVSTVTLQHGFS